jgi:hypothetical protein
VHVTSRKEVIYSLSRVVINNKCINLLRSRSKEKFLNFHMVQLDSVSFFVRSPFLLAETKRDIKFMYHGQPWHYFCKLAILTVRV